MEAAHWFWLSFTVMGATPCIPGATHLRLQTSYIVRVFQFDADVGRLGAVMSLTHAEVDQACWPAKPLVRIQAYHGRNVHKIDIESLSALVQAVVSSYTACQGYRVSELGAGPLLPSGPAK